MILRTARRSAIALVLALAVLAIPRRASADWISLSSSTPAPPGRMTNSERFFTWLIATGMLAPMIYAGVYAASGDDVPEDSKRDLGFALGGLGGTALMGTGLAVSDGGEPAFTYTLVGGMTLGMTGVGIGGAFAPHPRAMWLGGSSGYGAFALLRMILSLTGHVDYRGAAGAQIALGLIGTAGCLGTLGAAEGGERYYAYACGGLSAITVIHGAAVVGRKDKPRPPPEEPKPVSFVPMPWFTKNGGGLAIAGAF